MNKDEIAAKLIALAKTAPKPPKDLKPLSESLAEEVRKSRTGQHSDDYNRFSYLEDSNLGILPNIARAIKSKKKKNGSTDDSGK